MVDLFWVFFIIIFISGFIFVCWMIEWFLFLDLFEGFLRMGLFMFDFFLKFFSRINKGIFIFDCWGSGEKF